MTFSPRQSLQDKDDGIANFLSITARYIFISSLLLSIIFFVPLESIPFGYSKTLLVGTGVFSALFFYALTILRIGRTNLYLTPLTYSVWIILFVTSISALFSTALNESFFGSSASPQTVLFLSILTLTITLSSILIRSKKTIVHIYITFFLIGILLALYHGFRLAFGPELLSFGLTTSAIFTPLGSWNDLGVFFGFIVILSLITLIQLPLPRITQYLFLATIALSLIILTVVQFTLVWVVVGLISTISLMYCLVRHRFDTHYHEESSLSIFAATAITIAAVITIIGGGTLGGFINSKTGIDYIEIRPSYTATLEVARNVYQDNPILGIGPNRFNDAWRLHKNPDINRTIFWNTEFANGTSFLTTIFATSGILVLFSWLFFFFAFLYMAYKMLIVATVSDRTWYFIGTSSFVASLYLWIQAFLYIPSQVILFITALATGIFIVSYTNLCDTPVVKFSSLTNKRASVILVAKVLFISLVSIYAIYFMFNQFFAVYNANQSVTALTNGDVNISNERIENAFRLSPHHSYARQRALNSIFTMNDTTNSEIFISEAVAGLAAAEQSVVLNRYDARNWATLASLSSLITSRGVDNAVNRGLSSIDQAILLEPLNPEYFTIKARLHMFNQNTEEALIALNKALELKSDFTPAISFLAEIQIEQENIADAINSVIAILRLDPTNAGRFYQLGVLLLANNNQDEAIVALQEAISLNNDFSNARYVLALQYIEREERELAIEQLSAVSALNPENEDVSQLLSALMNNEPIEIIDSTEINALQDGSGIDTIIDSQNIPDSSLLSPVNTPAIIPSESPSIESETTISNPDSLQQNTQPFIQTSSNSDE